MNTQNIAKLIIRLDQEIYLNNLSEMKDLILKTIPPDAVKQEDAILLFNKLKDSDLVRNSLAKNFGDVDKMWRSLLKEYKIPSFKLWS